MEIEIRVLGEVTVRGATGVVDPGPARQRCVLAALAVEVGRVVPTQRLVTRVWGADPPHRARATLSSYVSRLRTVLARASSSPGGGELLQRASGYVLSLDDMAVDLHRFSTLRSRARSARDEEAELLLSEAVQLWRGEAFSGLDGEWVAAERDRLHLERFAAEADLIDLRLRNGSGDDLVAWLAARTAEHPLDERATGQYMLALYRAGRAADALEHYRRHRDWLAEELGADPRDSLRSLHRRILASDPTLDAVARPASTVTPVVVPRQLPAVPAAFVGRLDELGRLDIAGDASFTTTVVSAIAGNGGVGKTWLALHWAHRRLDRFPDGQLFVDLRGFGPDGRPMEAGTALRGFLDTLGVRPGAVPADPHAQSALFRSLVAGKRMLIVLDNAATADQVEPLLPGGGSCTVLVTSRNHLPSLITRHGAHHLALDALTEAEARALLTHRLGAARADAESAAIDAIITACGGLPLALGIIAGRAQLRPGLPLSLLATEIIESGLHALDDETAGLPAVLSWSYRALNADQATAFALLGVAPGPDIALAAVAALLDRPLSVTRTVLRGLVHASLLEQDSQGRYRMHDLVRQYAASLPVRDGGLARRRVLDHYAHTARTAMRLVHPRMRDFAHDPGLPGHAPEPLASREQAWLWFRHEQRCVLAAQRLAIDLDDHRTAYLIARYLYPFHFMTADFAHEVESWRTALPAVLRLDDPTAHGDAYRSLGWALCSVGRLDEGTRYLDTALGIAEETGDDRCLSGVYIAFALALGDQGRHADALRSATQAIHLISRTEPSPSTSTARTIAAHHAARLGHHDLATAHCHAVLQELRGHPDRDIEANVLFTLGLVAIGTGDTRHAVTQLETALALFRDDANTFMQADTLEKLAEALDALDHHDQARRHRRAAASLYLAQQRQNDLRRVRQQESNQSQR
ncbi:BTAD domain-containing putative transcriptional regulator [Actinosynnema sp. NPDC047251]|uniref:AfsR/SARP family transcriptional regulator n=1 Tax=Saccharothrix espanaensis TaxID=103731 RepID=UPI00059B6B87|nr:BTAD domain-containing putative transcriptional regulator [Saccharothrix espanaensis]